MLKSSFKTIVLVIMILCLAVPLTGCRESLVIAKILHDQQAEEKEKDKFVVKNKEDADEKDDILPQLDEDKSERKNDEQKLASTRGSQSNPGQAFRTKHSDDSANNNKADKSGSGRGDKKNKNKNNSSSGGENGGGSTDDTDSGQGQKRQEYDDDGNVIDLPETVNSVVAPGEAGLIVQMVGGRDILSGTSASVSSDPLAQQVFADEGIANTLTYWDADGSSPMTTENFNALIANKPDVCIAVGGKGSFSTGQVASLKKAGIAYVTLPALDTQEHIEKAVSIAGKMIGNRSSTGGQNAKSVASQYENYCGTLLSNVRKKVRNSADNTFSLYIAGWDPNAVFTLPETGFSESGVAYTTRAGRPIAEHLLTGGVTESSMAYSMNASALYAVIPININTERNPNVSDGLSFLNKTDNNSFVRYGAVYLGENHFKWVIADSAYTAGCITSSAGSNGMWTNFGKTTYSSGGTSITDYGFLEGDHLVRTNIHGDYQILVNPYGIGSWADGSVESPLESIWAAWAIAGKYSESDVREEISYFYSTFYRHDLTDEQIDMILAGI